MVRKLIIVATCVFPSLASAHLTGRSYSSTEVDGDNLRSRLDIDPTDLGVKFTERFDENGSRDLEEAEFNTYYNTLVEIFADFLVVYRGDQRCENEVVDLRFLTSAHLLRADLRHRCDTPGPVRIDVVLLDQMTRNHTHILGVRLDKAVYSAPMTVSQPVWQQPQKATLLSTLGRFWVLGLEHILVGYDHLMFVFALLLASQSLGLLVRWITAFTLAHSVTLIAAALNWVQLSPTLVEPLIALTVAYVGIENLLVKNISYRWILTLAVGLIHGFGFASVLRESGLPPEHSLWALLSFNLGVEAGQLLAIFSVLPLLWLLRHRFFFEEKYPAFLKVGNIVVTLFGVAWFIERIWAGLE